MAGFGNRRGNTPCVLSLSKLQQSLRPRWWTSASVNEGEDKDVAGRNDGIRINKCFKSFASRRKADEWIASGRVRVNGDIASPGKRVFPGDEVKLDGKIIEWENLAVLKPENPNQFVYIKYWKPRGIICTTDTRIKHNIIDAVNFKEQRIYPVGRLDKDSSGLILLTSDGRLPNAILRAKREHRKIYRVTVDKPLKVEDIKALREGVVITTVAQRDNKAKPLTAPTLPAKVELLDAKEVIMGIHEGRNRQIRKMMEVLGYKVDTLHREKILDIGLERLNPGKWVHLDNKEMSIVKNVLNNVTHPQKA